MDWKEVLQRIRVGEDEQTEFGCFTEERVVPGTGTDAIEPQAFRDYMRRKGVDLDAEPLLPFEIDLFNREVLGRDLDGTLLAILFRLFCFDKEPQGYPPTRNLWVDLVAYAGTDRGDDVRLAGEARSRSRCRPFGSVWSMPLHTGTTASWVPGSWSRSSTTGWW